MVIYIKNQKVKLENKYIENYNQRIVKFNSNDMSFVVFKL